MKLSSLKPFLFPAKISVPNRSLPPVRSMATAYQIRVAATETGILEFKQDELSATKVSELLQQDIEKHHVFFNDSGFHNHIVHHLLTVYGTGAPSNIIQKAYNDNVGYQQPSRPAHSSVLAELKSSYFTSARKYYGEGKYYADFFQFFQHEIAEKGWEKVLMEYVFTEDNDDLFARLYAGFLHPMIQLMFGVEWQQPAIVASALAQTAVHKDRLGDFFLASERAAVALQSHVPFFSLYEELKKPENEKLAKSASWDDPNRIYDGVLKRAPQEAVQLASRVRVRKEELEERTAEMAHVSAFVAAAASWREPYVPKYDFYLIHHLNAAPIFLTLNKFPWLPIAQKVRLLEWKLRLDLVQYIARGCPPLSQSILSTYTPKDKTLVEKPKDLLERFHPLPDDGHTIKVVRALMIAQDVSKNWEDREWMKIRGNDQWLKAHYMLLDDVEAAGSRWVRSAGFDQAWKDMPKKDW